jgi:hypothetical protein
VSPAVIAAVFGLGEKVAEEVLAAVIDAFRAGKTHEQVLEAIRLPPEFQSRFTAELEATAKE